jgi:hypothetical protein
MVMHSFCKNIFLNPLDQRNYKIRYLETTIPELDLESAFAHNLNNVSIKSKKSIYIISELSSQFLYPGQH